MLTACLVLGCNGDQFMGWGRDNMTTIEYLENMLVENKVIVKAFVSESLIYRYTTESNLLEVEKLRITHNKGQCYSVAIPRKTFDGMTKLVAYINLPEEAKTKIFLYDPNTYNGYFDTAKPLSLVKNSLYTIFDVNIEETILDPKDPKVTCAIYEEQQSFIDCSNEAAEATFIPLLGCVPPWFTDDQRRVCQEKDTLRINEMREDTFNSYVKSILGKFIKPEMSLQNHSQIHSWTVTTPSAPSPAPPSTSELP